MNGQPKVNRHLISISSTEERSTTSKQRKKSDTMTETDDNFKETKNNIQRWQKLHQDTTKIKKEYLEKGS